MSYENIPRSKLLRDVCKDGDNSWKNKNDYQVVQTKKFSILNTKMACMCEARYTDWLLVRE